MADTLPNLETYAAIAAAYAEHTRDNPHNAHYERPATLALAGDVAGRRVLDAGCGPGHLAAELAARGARVDAFDVNPAFVAITKARAAAHVFAHDLARPWRFAGDGAYDLVVASLVLDYLLDWTGVLAEARRVLAPGGALIASCVHPLVAFEASPSGDYFRREALAVPWPTYGVEIRSYRRPLEDVVAAVGAAGLRLDALVEPRPSEACRVRWPDKYAQLARRPGFLVWRARA